MIEVESTDEIGVLTTTFNDMASVLQETLEAVENERNKLDTLFLHMTDGVAAFSPDGKIIHYNPAATQMLGKPLDAAVTYDERSLDQFYAEDFIPFREGIAAGADAILVNHNIVTSMDADNPASLSPAVHQILREELGFTGVIVTDDLYMDAIRTSMEIGEAAIRAVEAGNDLLCVTEFEQQVPAVIEAVRSGRISEERIEESALRILLWKIDLGLIQ